MRFMKTSLVTLVAVLTAVGAANALAAGKKSSQTKSTTKVDVPKLDMGSFGAIPSADGVKNTKSGESALPAGPKVQAVEAVYEIVAVKHARNFSRGAGGAEPVGGELKSVILSGKPPTIDKFTTLVKVKCAQRLDTSIEVAILDSRGDTAMSGEGELSYRSVKGDVADYTVDWPPTPRPSGGEYQVLVRVAGKPMGTWPLHVEQK